MPCEQPLVQTRFSKAEMDSLLRKEREGTLTSPRIQKTFSFLKPEALRLRIIGEIVSRIEKKGLHLKQLRLHDISPSEAERLYQAHLKKPFFKELVNHVTSGPVILMVIEGPNAVETVRRLIGPTDPLVAGPGTIRGDYSTSITANVIHASDTLKSAKREASIFFRDEL